MKVPPPSLLTKAVCSVKKVVTHWTSVHNLKVHCKNINFIEEKGICCGCLQEGHISRDCRTQIKCNVCGQNHPGILHENQDKGISTERSEQPVKTTVSIATAIPQTCGHMRAGFEDDCIFSIVPVQVKSQKGDEVLQTYVFLDPGSSGTFCTNSLAQQLNVNRWRTSILLRTMGQEKTVVSHVISGLEVSGLDMMTSLSCLMCSNKSACLGRS